MILGDPYNFAIFTQTIKQWNADTSFCNGILLFSINGKSFPKEILTATLKSEIQPLKEKLGNLVINDELYNMGKEEAFSEIYNITFPSEWDTENDYRYDITPLSFSDNNCYVFAVSNGKNIRIMASGMKYIAEESRHDLNNIEVSETFVSVQELQTIADQLDIFY